MLTKKRLRWMGVTLCLMLVIGMLAGCGSSAKKETTAAPQWPTKDITMIYHSKPGSGGDIYLRSLAKPMEKVLGKNVIVDNRPGAGNLNAWKPAAEAKDGHTFLGISSTLITAPILNPMPVSYKSYDPVAMMFIDPMILFVAKDAPWKTLQEFIDDAKNNPGKYNIAGGVPGELGFVAGMQLMEKAGIKMNIVPFESGADAAVSVLGGHIHGAIGEYAETASAIESGKVRVLVGFNPVPGADIKTVKDFKLDIQIEKLRGIVAPKGTPQPVIDKMIAACKAAMDDPEFKKYYTNMKLVPVFKTGADFTKVMAEQDAQIRKYSEVKK
jgi:tripartite-type tricarboxylate transporter receptor subunit TctC